MPVEKTATEFSVLKEVGLEITFIPADGGLTALVECLEHLDPVESGQALESIINLALKN